MYFVSLSSLSSALLAFLFTFSALGQAHPEKDLSPLCAKAGFVIQVKSSDFDVYRYQKAFLNFDRLDSFRLEDKQAAYVLENGEASILLASAAEIRDRHGKRIDNACIRQPAIRFVLNVNGQVKEQPIN